MTVERKVVYITEIFRFALNDNTNWSLLQIVPSAIASVLRW